MNTIIQTPTNALQQSLDFYTRLQFTVVSKEAPTLISDGSVLIEINPDRYARAGLKMYKDSWKSLVQDLQQMTTVIPIEGGHLLADPSGTWIYLIEGKPIGAIPEMEASSSTLGNFAGMSLETIDMKKSAEIWQLLGFEKTMGNIDQGWVAYQNEDKMGVSLMKPNACPHLFFNPSLTYFNSGQNLAVIQKIREAGIAITEEITHFNPDGIVDNVIIRDPGGYGFFVFND